jgi:hypothetical protein
MSMVMKGGEGVEEGAGVADRDAAAAAAATFRKKCRKCAWPSTCGGNRA